MPLLSSMDRLCRSVPSFPGIPRKSLMRWCSEKCNNRQYADANANYLVTAEVGRLLAATKESRNAARDRCLLLLMFRHGFTGCRRRAALQLSQVDVDNRVVHVQRLKQGLSTTQPLRPEKSARSRRG